MRILIVEDEVIIAEGVALTLQMAGYEVTNIADDLDSAVFSATQNRPDMALVDIKLANGSNGLDVARQLKPMGISCVFATGNPPSVTQASSVGLGYIVKPYTPKLLVQTVSFVAHVLANGSSAGHHRPNGFTPL